jgi:hypothetical protein
MSQQIEVAKMQTYKTINDRKVLSSKYSTEIGAIQTDINNNLEMAKICNISDINDPIFVEVRRLMDQKMSRPLYYVFF